LDIDKGAKSLFNFLNACVQEMEQVTVSLGKTVITDLAKSDLCTLDPFISRATGVELGYIAPESQERFFNDVNQFVFKKPEEKDICKVIQ
jgi:hypothetical protein